MTSKMKNGLRLAFFTAAFSSLISLPAVAAEVTITGEIDKVVPEKREIYVLSEGKKLEFYFNAKTELTKSGQPLAFEVLKKSQKVKVTADKIGKRLDPLKVELLD